MLSRPRYALLASLVLLEAPATAFFLDDEALQSGSVYCINGWQNGNGISVGPTEFMATGSTLTKEACAELVKNGKVANCSGANGATQRAFGGCYCEFNMDDLVNKADGSMTCLFAGEWKYAGVSSLIVAAVFFGSTYFCCCCCFIIFYRRKCVDKFVAFKEDTLGLVQDEDDGRLTSREDFLRVTPEYWKNQDLGKNFDARHPPSKETQEQLKAMLLSTWKSKSTRDSRVDDGVWTPAGLSVLECIQVENRDLWLRYMKGKARIQRKRRGGVTPVGVARKSKVSQVDAFPAGSTMGKVKQKKNPFHDQPTHSAASSDGMCKTSAAMSKSMNKHLDKDLNEYYLLHGTTPEGAFGILDAGFKLSFVGSHKGTMFGRGCYFAECSSKSDEYARSGEGQLANIFAVLVCRVVCGELFRITHSNHKLIEKALDSGWYDGVLGDREAEIGTYREFVVFNEDVIYPEYIILYKREFSKE